MTTRFVSIVLAALAAMVPATAQDHDRSTDEKDIDNFRLLIEQEAKDLSVKYPQDSDIIALVERIMMVRLSQTLGLTVEETQDLGSRVEKCRSQVYNLKWLRADLRSSLRQSIDAGDEEATRQTLDKLLKLEVTIAQLIDQMIRDSEEELTLDQSAKFYLFIEDFEEELSQMVQKARELTLRKTGPHVSQQQSETTSESPSN